MDESMREEYIKRAMQMGFSREDAEMAFDLLLELNK